MHPPSCLFARPRPSRPTQGAVASKRIRDIATFDEPVQVPIVSLGASASRESFGSTLAADRTADNLATITGHYSTGNNTESPGAAGEAIRFGRAAFCAV